MNTTALPRYLNYMYSYPHKTAYRTFDSPVALFPCIKGLSDNRVSLYFHIPFCGQKCGFCNLFSLPGGYHNLIPQYLETLRKQAGQLSEITSGLEFTSFAIGGGTPLLLDAAQLDELFNIAVLFGVVPEKVFTSIETSPDYTTLEKLHLLKERGVQRLSIGIQSFHQEELYAVKRGTQLQACMSALEMIKNAGFPQFNIDLIYGIEGQTVDSFLYSIRKALSYNPTELFIYPLYVRPGTGIKTRADEVMYLNMYQAARDELLNKGFMQTSMRRFVRHGSTDLEYSCGDEAMISCGCGGRSYIGDLHFATPYEVKAGKIASVIEQYIRTEDFTTAAHGFLLSTEEKKRRYVIKNLMYHRGVDKTDYRMRFGEEIKLTYFEALFKDSFVEEYGDFIRLTEKGMAYSDYIGQLFISPDVKTLMSATKY